ncbi:fungal transcriptional regulatory protein [Echria macrotheca]|uniref:Fungal transcriptional regulatory protein n=1 Tax=Echria macrotheca TaxID=438768 RepID=A0AAJ0BAI1_9PEZI|nr:fungal transcriptional regulatory protein [Echria macrotheca]
MPLRAQTRIACQRCRKKRAKCDGQSPCARCDEAGESCEYDHIRRESKGELRAETVRLRRDTAESDTLLRAVASIVDPYMCRRVLQGLMDGTITRQAVLQEFYQESDSGGSTGPSPGSAQSGSGPLHSASTSSFGQLRSWKSCRPNIHNIDPSAGKDVEKLKLRGTILSLPPLPLDAYSSHAQTDTWTRTGWTKAHLRHLIDALRTWDYLPFCLFSEELFMRDYDSGATQYCSSALVHAILALATRLINESSDDTGLLPSGWKRSRVFLDEANGMLQTVRRLEGLPDIQALGMLSLYHLRCGRENEAHEVAKAFATSIRDLLVNSPTAGGDQDYMRVRNITYCGAVTLTRMLALASGRIFNIAEYTIQEDLFSIDQLPGGGLRGIPNKQGRPGPTPGLATDGNARPWDVQLIGASLFQLTEWVYQLIMAAQTDVQAASDELPAVYKRCLNWYTDIFSLQPPDAGRTPFVMFVHMYYHFCLLCAFRPFVSFVLNNSSLKPHEICIQATQSILALGQSYDELFTLRRVSGLIPYFICATGLFSLAMEEGGSEVDPVHLRPGDDASFMSGGEMDVGGAVPDSPIIYRSPETASSPSHVMMSAAGHARLLLAKMATTHPAAKQADKLLRQEIALTPPSASEETSTLGSM